MWQTSIVLLSVSFLHRKTDYMVSSQPTDARRALPCWDEPLLKAAFSVTLVSRKGTVSLSNMPARSDVAVADTFTEALFAGVHDGSWHATSFETTPPVSI
jgi:aminopeptidase 2